MSQVVVCSAPTPQTSPALLEDSGEGELHSISLKARPAPMWALAIAGPASQHPHPAPALGVQAFLNKWDETTASAPEWPQGAKSRSRHHCRLRVPVGCKARAATQRNRALMDTRAHWGGRGSDYRRLQFFPLHRHPVLHSRNLSLFQP